MRLAGIIMHTRRGGVRWYLAEMVIPLGFVWTEAICITW
jgi:hypothetical protein